MGSFLLKIALHQSSDTCGGYKCDRKSGIVLVAILSGSELLKKRRLAVQSHFQPRLSLEDTERKDDSLRSPQVDREAC